MKKKLTALFLAVVMCMTMSVPAFAVESDPVFTGPYAELKTSIYQQLKAQNKLEHFELHLAALNLEESETASVYSTSEDLGPWNAPSGGVLCYTYDWTYRGEDGYVANTITYMTPNETYAYLADDYGTLGKLISAITGIAVGELAEKIEMFAFLKDITPIFVTLDIIGLAEDVFVRASIDNADDYSKLSVVYDSISGQETKVLIGWDTHPTVTLNRTDAKHVSFD